KALKPNVLKLVSQNTEVIRALTDESAWLTVENIGTDARVKDAKGPLIKLAVPKEGLRGWMDAEMMLKGSHRHDKFETFINNMEQASWIAKNFLANGRPLFNEKAYKILVNTGHKERAEAFFYNKPETPLTMVLKGPSSNEQALYQPADLLTYYQPRNEQAMVHTAAAYARMRNRLATFACTTSIGPGATNMLTGAAGATINRIPVLLLPGDVFASRAPDPVLQQLEVPWRGDVSVNDTFQAVSRYWDRIERPEQLVDGALAAMRVLTSQADTGAVTLALPQDVQAEAWDFPLEFVETRVWHIPRPRPEDGLLRQAAQAIRSAARPLLVCGGGVIYSQA